MARKNNVSLFVQFKCPFSSEADIGSTEIYLEEINNYNSVVMEFSKQGGKDLYDFIRRCLSSVIIGCNVFLSWKEKQISI